MDPLNSQKLPLTITVTINEAGAAAKLAAGALESAALAAPSPQASQADGTAAVAALRANAQRAYYDEAQAATDRQNYYADIDWTRPAADVFRQLSARLTASHVRPLAYRPMLELYPWVDLHPDRKIHSIYSDETFDAEAFIQMDMRIDAARQAQLNEFVARAGMSFAALAQTVIDLEAQLPYNCEHSVPQSWFDKKSPMRGDLHHLFACESRCNSSRGNQPYFDYASTPAASNRCGDSGPQGFEPKGGKGAVARATLYFLLRYPGVIGDVSREFHASRLPLLLQWHRDNPVGLYELHRNQAIFERQGNRNPLIDFPDRATLIDFLAGFGHSPRLPAAEVVAALSLAPAAPPTAFQFGEPRPLELSRLVETPHEELAGVDASARTLLTTGAAVLTEATASFASRRFKPLPPAPGELPYRMTLSDILGAGAVARIERAGQFVFHTVGDTGQHGHGAQAQESVAFHMEQQIKGAGPAEKPALFYHLGDVVYYSGQLDLYPEQFYDPYKFYPAPIVAIPGNHDGDNVTGDRSLSAFVKNFCTATPEMPPRPGDSARLTMTQPNVYFTLDAPFATIIGLYSNVTGDLDAPGSGATPQFDWLVGELTAADRGKFLIIAVHHPVYSADNDHGGQKKLGRVLDEACRQANVLPHLVLTAHVHDYQHFERKQTLGTLRRTIPYIVAGAGGYAGYDSLHRVHDGVPFPPDVTLVKQNDERPGFLTITVSPDKLKGEYFVVPPPPYHIEADHPAMSFDSFEIDL